MERFFYRNMMHGSSSPIFTMRELLIELSWWIGNEVFDKAEG